MAAEIHTSLLRPAVLQILRATGFNYARPAVVETVTDLAARYLLLLASSTANHAFNTHNDFTPTVQDVRLAMTEVGALWPQMSTAEETLKGMVEVEPGGEVLPFEDLRGVRAFVDWAQGNANREIRRIAGFGADTEMNVEQIAAGTDERLDYLNALKKSGGKTDEASDSRYQGTILGKESELHPIPIIGGPVNSISEWSAQFLNSRHVTPQAPADDGPNSPASSMLSDAPLTPVIEGDEVQTPVSLGVVNESQLQTG